jgi:hypothetical protein
MQELLAEGGEPGDISEHDSAGAVVWRARVRWRRKERACKRSDARGSKLSKQARVGANRARERKRVGGPIRSIARGAASCGPGEDDASYACVHV